LAASALPAGYSGGGGGVDELASVDDVMTGSLPLDVMNNYFSIGADAHVTLVFHESRGIATTSTNRSVSTHRDPSEIFLRNESRIWCIL